MNDYVILVNDLFKIVDNAEEKVKIERVLWIDESYRHCFTIDIYDKKALPIFKRIEDLETELNSDTIVRLKNDPIARNPIEEKLTLKDKEIRDKAWQIIEYIANTENEPDIYDKRKRWQLSMEAKEKFGATDVTIYRYLRRYWQGGKTKNALLPNYNLSGGLGKDKKVTEKKRGRPRNISYIDEEKIGINVDEDVKKIFRISINKYYNNTKELSLSSTYDLMIQKFFSRNYVNNGMTEKKVLPYENIPTFGQFRYWFYKERDLIKEIKKRKGSKRFDLDYRSITSSSKVLGPGSRFEIDATVADVYIVSSYNRSSIIGRPIVYVVIDVFSRMVTGLYIGLEGPSWLGAMMAIANIVENKEEFCLRYEINIDKDEWICEGLPQTILADRGELEGNMPNNLIDNLKITIENASPYRGDLKGIVEQYFRTTNIKIKHWTPGFIKREYRERGERDYRHDAKLNIYEFTQMIIESIRFHNNSKWLDYYILDEDMINDEVEPIPAQLWNWGIRNRSGKLKKVSEDIVKMNLMPRGKATVLRSGIKFKNIFYSCESAISENWFSISEIKGSWQIDICYDPRNMSYIYIPSENGQAFEKCYILDKCERYKNKTFEEIEDLYFEENKRKDLKQTHINQKKMELNLQLDKISKQAAKKTNEESYNISKSQKIKDIKKNRSIEKELNRNEESWELDKRDKYNLAEIIELKRVNEDQSIESEDNHNLLDILKEIGDEN